MNSAGSILSNLKAKGMLPMLAQNSCYARIGFQGPTGSGKSKTALLLALGMSAELCDRAPIYAADSEPGWHFFKPIFAMEGIELIHKPCVTFKDFLKSVRDAHKEGACVHVADQLGMGWKELVKSFADESGYIGMQKQNQLRSHWDEFVAEWKTQPVHAIACGRLGWEWLNYEGDNGRIEFYKGNTQMKAGGGESFGYEVNLSCEFVSQQELEKDGSSRRRRKKVSHICTVLKDQTDVLNGVQFTFNDFVGGYKKGGYKKVFEAFRPHLDFLKQIAAVSMPAANSKDLVHYESGWQKDQTDRAVALEKFDALMTLLYPGQTGEEKRRRQIITFEITNTLSRTELEKTVFTKRLQWSADVMAALVERIKGGDLPTTDEQLREMVKLAKADVANPANKGLSLMEETIRKSIENVKTARVADGKLLAANGGTK